MHTGARAWKVLYCCHYLVYWMNADSVPTLRPSQSATVVSVPVGCYHLHPPSPFDIDTYTLTMTIKPRNNNRYISHTGTHWHVVQWRTCDREVTRSNTAVYHRITPQFSCYQVTSSQHNSCQMSPACTSHTFWSLAINYLLRPTGHKHKRLS